MHVYSLLEVNAFGVSATKSQVRVGTGLYWPTNLLDHSCTPNCVVVYRGRQQFLIAVKPIATGDPINISYIDQAIEDAHTRRFILGRDYYFTCSCQRCETCELPSLKFTLEGDLLKL